MPTTMVNWLNITEGCANVLPGKVINCAGQELSISLYLLVNWLCPFVIMN
jgi:hypothetical protein